MSAVPSTLSYLKQLIPIFNGSGQESGIRVFIQQQILDLGYTDITTDAAGNLWVHIPGDPQKETFLLSVHMDSVPPCQGIEAHEVQELHHSVLRAQGPTVLSADDKSGIAVILQLLTRLKAQGSLQHHPLELLFSVQEETGLVGAKAFDIKQSKASMVFVLDGEGDVGDIFNAGLKQKKPAI